MIPTIYAQQMLGLTDLLVTPRHRLDFGGPFNGQLFRRTIFEAVMGSIAFASIVETGTFRGGTALFMHRATGLPVYTVENNPRHYGCARVRLALRRRIHLHLGDSRFFLQQLYKTCVLPTGPSFFYLDAHGGSDLPLWEEVGFVLRNWASSLVMIDDFAVPGDDEYGYDDYGSGNALTVENLLAKCHAAESAALFFPRRAGKDETGARRGCVLMCVDPQLKVGLQTVKELRRYESID